MRAIEALRMARENGVRLGVAGADLILDADREPAPQVLDAIRRHKAGIVALLSAPGSDWSAEDWRAYFDERAGIGEHDGGLSRADAEARAYECCVVEWMRRHPSPPSGSERCGHCRQLLGTPGRDGVPFLTEGGHVWLHDACHSPWYAAARAEAARALMEMGIHVGQC